MSSNIEEDTCEEDFEEGVKGVDTESAGRLQEKRYKHLNPPAAFHIEEKWGVTNDLDVFAQWFDTGTAKQKEMVFKQILGFCCVAAFEQLATADERTNLLER